MSREISVKTRAHICIRDQPNWRKRHSFLLCQVCKVNPDEGSLIWPKRNSVCSSHKFGMIYLVERMERTWMKSCLYNKLKAHCVVCYPKSDRMVKSKFASPSQNEWDLQAKIEPPHLPEGYAGKRETGLIGDNWRFGKEVQTQTKYKNLGYFSGLSQGLVEWS